MWSDVNEPCRSRRDKANSKSQHQSSKAERRVDFLFHQIAHFSFQERLPALCRIPRRTATTAPGLWSTKLTSLKTQITSKLTILTNFTLQLPKGGRGAFGAESWLHQTSISTEWGDGLGHIWPEGFLTQPVQSRMGHQSAMGSQSNFLCLDWCSHGISYRYYHIISLSTTIPLLHFPCSFPQIWPVEIIILNSYDPSLKCFNYKSIGCLPWGGICGNPSRTQMCQASTMYVIKSCPKICHLNCLLAAELIGKKDKCSLS